MAGIQEMARELGQALGRTEEYQALKRAISGADDDRELVTLRNELNALEQKIAESIRAGREPEKEDADAYERAFNRLQASPVYQRLVAAQANFDRVVGRVNDTIAEAIQKGGESGIILPS